MTNGKDVTFDFEGIDFSIHVNPDQNRSKEIENAVSRYKSYGKKFVDGVDELGPNINWRKFVAAEKVSPESHDTRNTKISLEEMGVLVFSTTNSWTIIAEHHTILGPMIGQTKMFFRNHRDAEGWLEAIGGRGNIRKLVPNCP